MWQLASAFGEIALRRRGPESLPASQFLVAFLLGIYFLTSLFDLGVYDMLTGRGIAGAAAQVMLMFGYVFAVLRFFKVDRRYRQTMSAILGANLVIYFVFVPVALGSLMAGVPLDSAPLIWFRIGLFLWAVVVEATILARALSQPLILGFMFEFLYVLPSLSLSEYFATAPE
ncbi:MAG TPA: hypothetical protein VIV64_04295 [Gammaproteobacteria bacterium]